MDAQDDTGHTIAKSRGADEILEWWDRGARHANALRHAVSALVHSRISTGRAMSRFDLAVAATGDRRSNLGSYGLDPRGLSLGDQLEAKPATVLWRRFIRAHRAWRMRSPPPVHR